MNHTQEDHRIRVYSPYPARDSFIGLWISIAKQQHFLRLIIPPSSPSSPSSSCPTQTPTREMIDNAIKKQDGRLSPYSSHVFENYHVIYQKGGVVIVTNALPSPEIGTFFAVEDADSPHRYFIAFAFPVGGTMENITGLIVYFNQKGVCFSNNTIICNRVLANYDTRNGHLRSSRIFLYHQSLVFTQVHRDTKRLLLFLSHIPYQTDLIENTASYYTSYTVNYSSTQFGESISLFKRYLHIPLESGGTLLLDLGSLDCVEEKHVYQPITSIPLVEYQAHHYLTMTTYHILKKESVMGFLEAGQIFPEKEYSDGYPIHCAKCLQKVATASYGYKVSPYSAIHSGLGSGYCIDCQIRYSLTKKEWLCAAIRADGSICDGYIYEGWTCRDSHIHSQDQSILQLREGPLPRFPFRDKIRIQWVPTEEARMCAETARMIIKTDLYVSETPPLKVEDEL